MSASFWIIFMLGVSRLVAGDLVVEVTGKPGLKGKVHVGLCKDMATMKEGDKITLGKIAKLDAQGKAQVRFKGLRAGDYAIKLFLDQNGNHKLDKNRFGIPTEPYGLSNNVRPVFSIPKWEKLKFTIGAGKTVQRIKLRD